MSTVAAAPAVCKRCGHAAAAAWAAWWEGLDLSIIMPTDADSPLCPLCMTGREEIVFLAGCRSVRVLFATPKFDGVAPCIDERLRALLAAQTSEAES